MSLLRRGCFRCVAGRRSDEHNACANRRSERKMDAAQFPQACSALYGFPPDPQQQAQANAWILTFASQPEAWQAAAALLEPQNPPQVPDGRRIECACHVTCHVMMHICFAIVFPARLRCLSDRLFLRKHASHQGPEGLRAACALRCRGHCIADKVGASMRGLARGFVHGAHVNSRVYAPP